MGIGDKDQKILWARAAGRCAMVDCRLPLTLDTHAGGEATLGEMAHIVGRGEGSARSNSLLTESQRDAYANLILLCDTHHRLIDTDIARFPIEVLPQIKTEHELWVTESLSGPELDPDDLVYADQINSIATGLRLDNWHVLTSQVIRDRLDKRYVDTRQLFAHKLLGAIWPTKYPDLTTAIRAVLSASTDLITHFLSNAEHSDKSTLLGPDRTYLQYGHPKHERFRAYTDRWSRKNLWLLCRLCVELNDFAALVRMYLNPLFYRVQGEFLIDDELGRNFGAEPTVLRPSREMVETELVKIEAEEVADDFRDLHRPD